MANEDDTPKLRTSVETSWRPLERNPRYAPAAVNGVRGCAAPAEAYEV